MEIENISEADLMSALGDMDISSSSPQTRNEPLPVQKSSLSSEAIELSRDSVDGIAVLLKELLNNKTLEITIKIKD